MQDDINIDELYKGRGFVMDFARCGWTRGEDFIADRVINRLCGSAKGRETLRLLAKNDDNCASR